MTATATALATALVRVVVKMVVVKVVKVVGKMMVIPVGMEGAEPALIGPYHQLCQYRHQHQYQHQHRYQHRHQHGQSAQALACRVVALGRCTQVPLLVVGWRP